MLENRKIGFLDPELSAARAKCHANALLGQCG